ncbi:hypothetical protein Tco_1174547 [Tanacetum coccineum]
MKLGFLRSRNYEHEPGFELQRSKMKVMGYRERRCGASLNEGVNGVFIPKRDLRGQDRIAIEDSGDELEYLREVVSSGWSFVSTVPGQMTYSVASPTLDSAGSYVMQGAPLTQGTIPIIMIVVVVDDVSLFLKLSFVIIGFLHRIMLYYLIH